MTSDTLTCFFNIVTCVCICYTCLSVYSSAFPETIEENPDILNFGSDSPPVSSINNDMVEGSYFFDTIIQCVIKAFIMDAELDNPSTVSSLNINEDMETVSPLWNTISQIPIKALIIQGVVYLPQIINDNIYALPPRNL